MTKKLTAENSSMRETFYDNRSKEWWDDYFKRTEGTGAPVLICLSCKHYDPEGSCRIHDGRWFYRVAKTNECPDYAKKG